MYKSKLQCILRLDGLNDLEVLESFRDDVCYTEDLIKLTHLRVLVVSLCEKFENLKMIANYAQGSSMLQQVSIKNSGCCPNSSDQDKGVKVLKQLLYGRNIYRLTTFVQMWKEIPVFASSHISSSLVELDFFYVGNDVEETTWETAERFTHLRCLTLSGLNRKEMVSHAMSFPQLRKLIF